MFYMVYVYSVLYSMLRFYTHTHTDINGPALKHLENNFNKRVSCGMLYFYYIDLAVTFFLNISFLTFIRLQNNQFKTFSPLKRLLLSGENCVI